MFPEAGHHIKKKARKPQEINRPDIVVKRDTFHKLQPELNSGELIFIDETGFNTAMSRNYARSTRGDRAISYEPVKRSLNHSFTGALSKSGLITGMFIEGAVDGDAFKVFLRDFLAPLLTPGMIVVMDNLPAHKVEGVEQIISATGAQILYLPPYSPELNPIEECWSKLKSFIRKNKPRTVKELFDKLKHGMDQITESDCLGWFKHAGYCI